jgi:hypothetical protein
MTLKDEKACGSRVAHSCNPSYSATQEAEIRRIEVQSQLREIVCETILKKTITKKGWWSGSR